MKKEIECNCTTEKKSENNLIGTCWFCGFDVTSDETSYRINGDIICEECAKNEHLI